MKDPYLVNKILFVIIILAWWSEVDVMLSGQIAVDTHTHTLLSGHAFSTLNENIMWARKVGLAGICLTEHGPKIPGGVAEFVPTTQSLLPNIVDDICLYFGVEADIVDYEGNLDFSSKNLCELDFVIASFHSLVITPTEVKKNTVACIRALDNPYVDVIGHPCSPNIPIDTKVLAKAASQKGKALELNNNSIRLGMGEACKDMLLHCMKYNTPIVIASDAHYCRDVGNISFALEIVNAIDFPEELIMNRDQQTFETFIHYKKIFNKKK